MNARSLSSLASGLLLLSSVTVRADLAIIQEISSPANPKANMVTTTKSKGDRIRMDVGTDASMIIDTKSGEMLTLAHAQKIAIPVSAAMQKMAAKMAGMKSDADPVPPEFKATGRKQVLLGFPCEEYAATVQGQKLVMWVTKDVPEYKGLANQLHAFAAQMRQFQNPMANNPNLPGMPLLTEATDADGKVTTVRVQAISREPLKEADFQVPVDYSKIEMPAMPKME
jgi:hypothetical protein